MLVVTGLHAADPPRFKIEYMSGDFKWKCSYGACQGFMVLDPETIHITDDKKFRQAKVIFDIPLSTITSVKAEIRREDKGASRIIALQAATDVKEYVTIAYETADTAGALVFRVEEHTSDDIVAKIQFAMKRGKPSDHP